MALLHLPIMGAEILRKDDYGPCGFRWLTLKRITVRLKPSYFFLWLQTLDTL